MSIILFILGCAIIAIVGIPLLILVGAVMICGVCGFVGALFDVWRAILGFPEK